jgi:NAD(P)-dependent dehydrogenase (short-subunit alcohol dehydrogenase family)
MDRRRANDPNNAALLLAATGAGLFLLGRSLVRQSRWFDLDGKTVLVTGGSRGFGLLLAREFAARGANLVICSRNETDLSRAHSDLSASGAPVLTIPCDVSDEFQVRDMVAAAESRFGGIDVLVNNAGTITVGPMEVMTLADYEDAMKTHFWGPLYTTLAVLPGMKSRSRGGGGGRIVNITSIGGKVPAPHLLPYTASKFALVGFSEGLRAELKKDNVYVTTVVPGLIRTGSPRNASFKGQNRLEYAWFSVADSVPLTSMSARRAARRVVLACQRGEAEVTLSIQAKLAARFHGLFPGLSSDFSALVNSMLPGPEGGVGDRRVPGRMSESPVSESFLTALSRRAAEKNNQLATRTEPNP